MEITIRATAKEIADLIAEIQGQQLKTVRKPYSDQQITVLGDKIIEPCTAPKHD